MGPHQLSLRRHSHSSASNQREGLQEQPYTPPRPQTYHSGLIPPHILIQREVVAAKPAKLLLLQERRLIRALVQLVYNHSGVCNWCQIQSRLFSSHGIFAPVCCARYRKQLQGIPPRHLLTDCFGPSSYDVLDSCRDRRFCTAACCCSRVHCRQYKMPCNTHGRC